VKSVEKLTARKQTILDALDQEIDELSKKLEKVQPLINELDVLKQTRRVLLSERATTGGGGHSGPRLTVEEVVTVMRANRDSTGAKSMPVADIAEAVGYDENRVRSHLNRYRDERYERNGDGNWALIGEDEDEEE
jgi:hypothetical protein